MTRAIFNDEGKNGFYVIDIVSEHGYLKLSQN